MTTSPTIKPYPIEPIAKMPIDSAYTALSDTLLASLAEHGEQLRGLRIWLACSGGRDSLLLAALCLQLYHQKRLPFLPQLLHVDHGLQAGSQRWAQHLAKWAAAQQIPCTILQAQVKGDDEQAARLARYEVMRAHINQGDVLLLAHHADDQAETVLMRLIQGAGVKGLSAMQAWHIQRQGARHNVLWRPWLSIRRTLISAYAEQLMLPYIDDPTNDAGDNVRSGLRVEVMPLLAKYNANVIENIARSAALLSDAQATISTQAAQDMQETASRSLCYPPAQRMLDIERVTMLPRYRQRQLLHYWLAQDEPLPPSKQLIDDVIDLIERHDNNHQTRLDWYAKQQRYSICRYRQQLYRLSHAWLEWLSIPINEQVQTLSPSSQSQLTTISLRASQGYYQSYHWQLDVAVDKLKSYLNYQANLALKVSPLDRQQRLQTAQAHRPQAGKKLLQTLGIPVWLRESLVVVSIVFDDLDSFCELKNSDEIALLLLSPFDSWVLGFGKEFDNQLDKSLIETPSCDGLLKDAFYNILTVND